MTAPLAERVQADQHACEQGGPGASEAEAEATALPLRSGTFAALHFRDFRIFIIGAVVSNIGTWMQNIALGYLIYQLTGSPFWVGLIGFAQLFPMALLGLFSGALADRFDRRKILMWGQSGAMVMAGVLAVVYQLGWANRWTLMGIVSGIGVCAAISIPSWQTMIPDLVPRDRMFNAITLNSAQFNVARAFGPVLAGVVVDRFGITVAFAANAVSYLAVLWALAVVRTVRPQQIATEPPLERVKGGLRFVRDQPGVRRALLTVSVASLVGIPVMQHLPSLNGALHGNASGLGLLGGALGAGSVAGALIINLTEGRLTRSKLVTIGFFGFGFLLVAVGYSPRLWVAAAFLVPLGLFYLAVLATLNTGTQLLTPDAFRGRVMSIYILGFAGLMPVGALLEGLLAKAIGIGHTLAVAGVILLAYIAVAAGRRRLDVLDHDSAEPEPVAA